MATRKSVRQVEATKRRQLASAADKALRCVERIAERQDKRIKSQIEDLAEMRNCIVVWRDLNAEYHSFLMESVR